MSGPLPAAFSDLDPFLSYWSTDTIEEAMVRRTTTPMEDIRTFYDTAIGRVPAILDHLDEFSIGELPDPEQRLYRLMLGVIQAAVAVEVYGQARNPNASYPNNLRLLKGRG